MPQESTPTFSWEKHQKRLKRLTNPGGVFFVGWKHHLLNTLALAAMVSIGVLAFFPPDNAPAPRTKGEMVEYQPIFINLQNVIASHSAQKISLGEKQINDYLFNTVKAQEEELPLLGKVAKFDRVYVSLEECSCRVTICQTLYDHPFYLSSIYQIGIKGGKLQANITGGGLGRLSIHPRIMQYADEYVFGSLRESLKRERSLLEKMQSVEIHKGQIILGTKGDLTPVPAK